MNKLIIKFIQKSTDSRIAKTILKLKMKWEYIKKLKMPISGKDTKKLDHSQVAGENVKPYSYSRKELDIFL